MNQNNTDSVNIFEQISQICREFRRQLTQGTSPPIEKFLSGIANDGRETLFSNLLEIELRFRQSKGESPTSEEYIQRFPQFAKQVRRAFFEPTVASIETSLSDDGATQSLKAAGAKSEHSLNLHIPDANRLGDYELVRELGRGGMGVVYEARHTKTDNRVALKTLPTGGSGQEVNAEKLYRFRREFRNLSEINHPNLVGMQTLEVDGSQWFFTMDLIRGSDFRSYVRPNDWLDEKHLRSSIKQLASGIVALHEHGIIHRDLKPGNVLVEPNGRVLILDFGLVAQLQQQTEMTATRSAMFAGTPLYAAPEQMFGERSEASDWYAMGVMLYEALTGAPPFPGRNPMEVLQKKQVEDPPSISHRDDIPNDLALFAEKLVKRDPNERPSTTEIVQQLGLDQESTAHPSSGSVDNEVGNLDDIPEEEIVLIGREEQLAQLEAIKNRFLEDRKPQVVWVTGLSGEGKSSLLEKFLRPIRKGREMLVLSGRCYDRESVPFKAIDSIIDPLVRYLRAFPESEIETILPNDIEMLAHLFPLLQRVPAIESRMQQQVASLDSRQIRYRAFESLRALFELIGARNPVVLMIDDLQWGDADSAAALHTLIYGDAPPPALFLGTYRSDEMDESSFHRQWHQLDDEKEQPTEKHYIKLEALQRDQCLALIHNRLGIQEAEIEKLFSGLFENTQGNPYLIEQLIEGFNSNATDWRPVPLNEVITQKLRRLPEGSKSLLEFVAIAGKAAQASELSAVCGTESTTLTLLTHMRSERLVRLVGSGDGQLVDTWHDKIRETVIDGLAPERRSAMHLNYGEVLASHDDLSESAVESFLNRPFADESPPEFSTAKIFDLAYHFHLADDRRALAYQLVAGELAFQNYASEEVIEYMDRASDLFHGDEPRRWHARLWHRLATSSFRIMAPDRAVEQFESGLDFAESGHEKAIFYFGIGRVYQTLSRYEAATKYHDLALGEINRKRPKGLSAYPMFMFNLAKLTCFPESWLRGKSAELSPEAKLELAIYAEANLYFYDSFVSIVEEFGLIVRLGILSYQSEQAGFTSGVGIFGGYMALFGFPGQGIRHANRARARVDEKTEIETEGICRYSTAVALSYSADFAKSNEEFEKSIPLLVRSGSHSHAAMSMHMLRHLHEVFDSANSEVVTARKLIELTRNSGNQRSLCWGQYDLAGGLARLGQIEESLQMIEQARMTWEKLDLNLTTAIYSAQRSFVLLQASDYEASREISDFSWRTAIKYLRLMDVVLRGLAWHLECVAGPDWSSKPLAFDRRLVRQRCRWARIVAMLHVKIRPHLIRCRGRAFTALGKKRKGIRNFELAVKTARQLGMKYDLGKSLLDLAAVKEEGREENRAKAIELLKEMESVIPRAESWLLGDQYDESVVAPEFDLKAWEKENGPFASVDEYSPR